jgi:hypothetical protein
MKRFFTVRNIIAAAALLIGILIVFYAKVQPGRAPGTQTLTNIETIDTLRTQFNRDVGKIRLVILVSPT